MSYVGCVFVGGLCVRVWVVCSCVGCELYGVWVVYFVGGLCVLGVVFDLCRMWVVCFVCRLCVVWSVGCVFCGWMVCFGGGR